jgi:hypothetical protein
MLNIDCGEHVNARIEQFFHILPAFGMSATGGVAVRQFVHQDQRRPPRQGGIQIKLPQRPISMGNFLARQLFKAIKQRSGFLAAMRFRQSNDDIQALLAQLAGGLQHRVGFADSRRRAEEDFQLAAQGSRLVFLEAVEQLIGIGS